MLPYSDTVVDDSDLDRIRYIGPQESQSAEEDTAAWIHDELTNGTAPYFYNATLSSCIQPGCMAFFTFKGMISFALPPT